MPRKATSYKRHTVNPDYKYNSVKIAKFINYIMERGKKTVANKLVYGAFDIIEKEMSAEGGKAAGLAAPTTRSQWKWPSPARLPLA